MSGTFHDVEIVEVIEERCHILEGANMRILLQLSSAPPVGWAYLFNLAWRAAPHQVSRRVGIDGDELWIECPPGEVLTQHLANLEAAMAKANQSFWAAQLKRLEAKQAAKELADQARSQLSELATALNRKVPPLSVEPTEEPERRTSRLRTLLEKFSRSMFCHRANTREVQTMD